MRVRLRLFVVILFASAVACVGLSARGWRGDVITAQGAQARATRGAGGDAPQEKTAEQVYKNIQVFKGLPASQLQMAMTYISGALGVRCSHCHAGSFERDERPAKQTARRMIRMVSELNRANFGGGDAVTCYTCHRGQPRPVSIPAVGQNLWGGARPAGAGAPAPLPTLEEVLDKYLRAVGGGAALARVKTRVLKGQRVGADGVLVPEEVYQKAPNKLLVVTSYPQVVFRSGFDGERVWARDSRGGDARPGEAESSELEREAEFYKESRLRELYAEMTVEGRAAVGERAAVVVGAKTRRGGAERLYFDAQTGLLLRRYIEVRTPLGPLPTQIDYEDYREVDGVRLPFMIRWSIPGRSWGRKIAEVRQNVPLDDKAFEPPAAKN